jgi:hypothetical protein
MGKVAGQRDRLVLLGEFRDIVDAIAAGGIIPSGGYESLRRALLSDGSLQPLLPEWLTTTRTSDEARALLAKQRNPSGFINATLEPALSSLEDREFKPPRQGGPSPVNCPYCTITMSPVRDRMSLGGSMFWTDQGMQARVEAVGCPECKGAFLLHTHYETLDGREPGTATWHDLDSAVLWPRVSTRQPVPVEVPEPYASLTREAGLILTDSPRASAALSRRCLQQLLREKAGATSASRPDLFNEIEWALQNASLPSHLEEGLHELREIGNMAAHPNKSTATGDYLEVEPGEAEWALDVLDGLLDFYFVQPAKAAARKAAFDSRLGKSPSP